MVSLEQYYHKAFADNQRQSAYSAVIRRITFTSAEDAKNIMFDGVDAEKRFNCIFSTRNKVESIIMQQSVGHCTHSACNSGSSASVGAIAAVLYASIRDGRRVHSVGTLNSRIILKHRLHCEQVNRAAQSPNAELSMRIDEENISAFVEQFWRMCLYVVPADARSKVPEE